MIHLITGAGKGKTTSALGTALLAATKGARVEFIMFMKGRIAYGEISSCPHLGGFMTIRRMGRPDFVNRENPDPVDIEWAQKAMAMAAEIVDNGKADLMVLDEVLVAVDFRLIEEAELLRLMERIPERMTVILTGRWATEEVIKLADTATECVERKHYFRRGVVSREGFDF